MSDERLPDLELVRQFKERITEGPLAVVGLGYVGLTNAILFANVGLDVVGVDVNEERIQAVNEGTWPLDPDEPTLPNLLHTVVSEGKLHATSDYRETADCPAVIIAVPTAVYDRGLPNLEHLDAALDGIVRTSNCRKLIVIASTISPGTSEHVWNRDRRRHFVAHAPERLSAGTLVHNFLNVPRVIGGVTPEATLLAVALYEILIPFGDFATTDTTTAEFVKTAENAYRDVQIAFAHELLWLCDDYGVDFWEARNLINTCPGRDVHYASAGVGGHCLPKDSLLLIHGMHRRAGALMQTARLLNQMQSEYVAGLILECIEDCLSCSLDTPRVLILGVAYKADTRDARNSPAHAIAEQIQRSATVTMHDPYVPESGMPDVSWLDAADRQDVIVFVQPHTPYLRPPWGVLRDRMRERIVIDATGCIPAPPDDFTFWQIGREHG